MPKEITFQGERLLIVFQSPVQSGFLCLFGGNQTATGFFISLFSHNRTETGQDQSFGCLACVRTGHNRFLHDWCISSIISNYNVYATNKPHVCNYFFHYYHPPCLVNPLANDNQQKKEQPYNKLCCDNC